MTTNQTIDGVPLLPCPFCGGEPYGTHDHYVHDDLSPMPCVECRACSAHLKAEDWNRRAEPASQPRGETVAWHCVGDIGTEHVTLSQDCADAWFSHGGRSLPLVYAEQPAQVAVVMPERKHVPDFRRHPMLNKEYTGWNACLDELKRLNPSL